MKTCSYNHEEIQHSSEVCPYCHSMLAALNAIDIWKLAVEQWKELNNDAEREGAQWKLAAEVKDNALLKATMRVEALEADLSRLQRTIDQMECAEAEDRSAGYPTP